MIRAFIIAGMLLMAKAADAQQIKLVSGEHADFSRVVLQFKKSVNWEFGRVESGYEFRTDTPDISFDLASVYDLIPRTRISDISSPGPGRLQFSVQCTCAGDAFEIRAGRIVIDIKDGAPNSDSPFEKLLTANRGEVNSEIGDSDTVVANHAAAGAPAAPQDWQNFGAPFPGDPNSTQGENNAAIPVSQTGQRGLITDRPPTAIQRGENLPMLGGELQTAVSEIFAAPVPSLDSPQLENTNSDAILEAEFDNQTSITDAVQDRPTNPEILDQSTPVDWEIIANRELKKLITSKSNVGIDALEMRLLEQLGRAAAQGLVVLPPPTISHASPEKLVLAQEQTDAEAQVENTVSRPAESDPPAHFQLQTAVDRDRPSRQRTQLTSSGGACIENDVLDLAGWGNVDAHLSPFDALRTGIVGEFDAPNPDAILDLVHRLLYLGFGIEAKSLVNGFQVALPNSDILIQISEIMDEGRSFTYGRLNQQLSCNTNAAIWAILADTQVPAGAEFDKKQILLTFSGFPPHLRRHLGPTLAQRFFDIGDIEMATSVRDLVNRAPGDQRSAGFLTEAHLASFSSEISEKIEFLQEAVNAGGPASAAALAELIESKLSAGQAITEKTALLAGAMAVENRDSEIGRRLTRAAIRAFAISGQIGPTFERIQTAFEHEYITQSEALELNAETHLRNAEIASDYDFLFAAHRHVHLLNGSNEKSQYARRKTATRLISLGFPEYAMGLYFGQSSELEGPDLKILAAAEFAAGNGENALARLAGVDDDDARAMTAEILTGQNDHANAEGIYNSLAMEPEMEQSAWLAGDWDLVAQHGNVARASAARMIVEQRIGNMAPEEGDDEPPISIAASNNLVDRSRKTREILNDLLAGQ